MESGGVVCGGVLRVGDPMLSISPTDSWYAAQKKYKLMNYVTEEIVVMAARKRTTVKDPLTDAAATGFCLGVEQSLIIKGNHTSSMNSHNS